MNIIKTAESLRDNINSESLYPVIAATAFYLGEENMIIGENGRIESFDLITAIATIFQSGHEYTTWEDHEETWEESLQNHVLKMIRIHNIKVTQ